MCVSGSHRPSAAFSFMRDARGNESFGTFTRRAFENSGERVHLQNSPASLFAQSDVKYNSIGMGWGNARRCSKATRKLMKLIKELYRCARSDKHSHYTYNSQNYVIRKFL